MFCQEKKTSYLCKPFWRKSQKDNNKVFKENKVN